MDVGGYASEIIGNVNSIHSVQLTQDDTLALDSALNVDIQIRAGFGGEGGSRVRSNIVTASVEKILKDGAI